MVVSGQDSTSILYSYPKNYTFKNISSIASVKDKIALLIYSEPATCSRLFLFNGIEFNALGGALHLSEEAYLLTLNDNLGVIVDYDSCFIVDYNKGVINSIEYYDYIHKGHVYKMINVLSIKWIVGIEDEHVYYISSHTSEDVHRQNILLVTHPNANLFRCLALDSTGLDGGVYLQLAAPDGIIRKFNMQVADTSILIEMDTVHSCIQINRFIPTTSTFVFEYSFCELPFRLNHNTSSIVAGAYLLMYDPKCTRLYAYPLTYGSEPKVFLTNISLGLRKLHYADRMLYMFYEDYFLKIVFDE
jgi:hypothetical protein